MGRPVAIDSITCARAQVSLKELVVLTRQLSISINAGMSFVEALQGLASNTKNMKLGWSCAKF